MASLAYDTDGGRLAEDVCRLSRFWEVQLFLHVFFKVECEQVWDFAFLLRIFWKSRFGDLWRCRVGRTQSSAFSMFVVVASFANPASVESCTQVTT